MTSTKKITTVGMLCAMAIGLNLLVHVPLVPTVSFLNYDPKDIVIVIAGFIYGPGISFIMSAICSVFDIIIRGGTILDILMNMISTCTFCMTAAFIYKKVHTKHGGIIGLVCGVIAMTLSMLVWNYVVTPIYFGMERSLIVAMLPAIVLFNVLKSGLNAIVAFMVYKPVVNALRSSHLIATDKEVKLQKKDASIIAGFIGISVLVFVLSFNNVI